MEMPVAEVPQTTDPRRALLGRVFAALNSSGARWCIAHGYEKYADEIPVDIDCILDRSLTPQKLAELLHARRDDLNARIVQWLSDGAQWIVIASNDPTPVILQLHVSYDYVMANRIFMTGEHILENRQQKDDFWIAPPEVEFACILVNRLSKRKLDDRRQQRLATLFAQSPDQCVAQMHDLLSPDNQRLIAMSARTGNWAPAQQAMDALQKDLFSLRSPLKRKLASFVNRVRRYFKPPCGFHVVFLGPDGVGKSTVIEGVKEDLADAFLRTDYYTFAPSLIPQRLQTEKKTPHQLAPRSYPASLLKAAWWSVCYTGGYFASIQPAKARSSFVMNHRYLLDAIVDRRRYRYSGPVWLLKAIWKVAPKPHLVILLDADPETIWARKKEVALEETIKQRDGYRAVVEPLKFSRLVEAAQPAAQVRSEVDRIILDHLAARVNQRFGLEVNS
jgi:thymidylate kinase